MQTSELQRTSQEELMTLRPSDMQSLDLHIFNCRNNFCVEFESLNLTVEDCLFC